MSRGSVNKVVLIGNLGADPDVRFTASGAQVAHFNLATSESWQDKNGERQERTEWHRIVVWRRLAEIAAQYIKKGNKVYVEGKLQTRSWDDANGQKRYTTEIVAQTLEMLDGANGGPADLDLSYGRGQRASASQLNGPQGGEDDLPF